MNNRNQSEMLPYEKLAVLGIDRKKADQSAAGGKGKAGFRRGNRHSCRCRLSAEW